MNKIIITTLILTVSIIPFISTVPPSEIVYGKIGFIASDDSGRALPCPCRQPKGSEDDCEKLNTCQAWKNYYVCFKKFAFYCD